MAHKKALFLFRHDLRDTARGREFWEAAAMAAAFGVEVHVAFMDGGVFHLLPWPGQEEDLSPAPADCDIEHLWVEEESLFTHGLEPERLSFSPALLDAPALARLMAGMDMVFSA